MKKRPTSSDEEKLTIRKTDGWLQQSSHFVQLCPVFWMAQWFYQDPEVQSRLSARISKRDKIWWTAINCALHGNYGFSVGLLAFPTSISLQVLFTSWFPIVHSGNALSCLVCSGRQQQQQHVRFKYMLHRRWMGTCRRPSFSLLHSSASQWTLT